MNAIGMHAVQIDERRVGLDSPNLSVFAQPVKRQAVSTSDVEHLAFRDTSQLFLEDSSDEEISCLPPPVASEKVLVDPCVGLVHLVGSFRMSRTT